MLEKFISSSAFTGHSSFESQFMPIASPKEEENLLDPNLLES